MRPAPWIFLRGLMRDARHWGVFPEQFRAALPGAGIITLDLPGNGLLNAGTSPASVPAMAAWCRAELLRRGISPPYQLLAMSLGAMVAVAWAEAAADELEKLVLINTSLKPFSPFWQRLQPAAYPTVLRMALTSPSAAVAEQAILQLTSKQHQQDSALLAQWTQWHQTHPVSRANALRQLLAAMRYRAPLAAPHARILILTSRGDALVNHQCSTRLSSRWQTDLGTHASAGHDLPLDDGAWVAQQVQQWCSCHP